MQFSCVNGAVARETTAIRFLVVSGGYCRSSNPIIRSPIWSEPKNVRGGGDLYNQLPKLSLLLHVGYPMLLDEVCRYCMWFLKVCLGSISRPRNIASLTTLIGDLSNRIVGSGIIPLCLQKRIHTYTVLEGEHLKPVSEIQLWTLWTHNCMALYTLHRPIPNIQGKIVLK